jgi:hypothetical protein
MNLCENPKSESLPPGSEATSRRKRPKQVVKTVNEVAVLERVRKLFWERLPSREPDKCWEWAGPINVYGYGNHGHWLAHRTSYAIANGSFDLSLCVLHHCDNRRCCNPAHLFLGTRADNTKDMMSKGRGKYKVNNIICQGAGNCLAKLTDSTATQARAVYSTGKYTLKQVADQFGVSKSAVWFLVKRITWTHLA